MKRNIEMLTNKNLQIISRRLGIGLLALFYFIILLSSTALDAQVPKNAIGVNPQGLKWKQIDTDKVQVVFPQGQESDARRVADIVSYLWDYEGQDIGQLRSKISIFLHGHRVTSNGLVTVGPFRSEFYQTSPQMANSTSYLDLLTIHEYRHGQQFANATQGITKFVKSTFGSFAWGGMMALALPRWYFEGDAVVAETEHSATGRGRLPSFMMQYDALLDAGKRYSYEKAAAGSYRDFVPTWYPLGYNLMSYGKEKFGDDIWINVVNDAVRYKGIFTPFSRSLKKRTGLNASELYNESMASLQRKFNEKNGPWKTYKSPVFEYESTVINYSAPIYSGNSIIASRSAYDKVPAYYAIHKTGMVKKLVEHGRLTDAPFGTLSTDGGKIYWAELAFDARWSNRQWSVIYEYDLLHKKKKQLTNKSRLFAPAVNASGTKIIAVQVPDEQNHQLVILNLPNPQKQIEIDNPDGYAISQPKWIDENNVVAVLSKNENSHLATINVSTGKYSQITRSLPFQLSHPVHYGGKVYFSAAYESVNNIYVVSLDDGRLQKVTESRIGAFQPSISDNGEKMAFTEFTADGYKIKTIHLNSSEFQDYNLPTVSGDNKSMDHEHESILDDLPSGNYKIKKYSHLSGLINPHSLLTDINDRSAELTIRSDNKFNTMSIEAGARYDFNEDRWGYGIQMNYAEFYPIIHAGISRRYRSAESLNFQELTDTSVVFANYVSEWAENSINLGVTIPYNFSKGNMNNRIELRTDYIRTSIDQSRDIDDQRVFRDTLEGDGALRQFEDIIDDPLGDGSFATVDTRFSFQMIKNRAIQNVAPRLGVALFGRYRNNLDDANFGGDVWSYGGTLFLPGFGSNHSLSIQGYFQNENVVSRYRYGDANAYPRGYNVSFRRDNFGKIGFNYSFPIAYPDIAIGGLAFVKRIKGKAFYDHGWLEYTSFPGQPTKQDQRSLGFELGLDFRAFRLVEVDLGIRYSYLLDPELLGNDRSAHQFDFFVLSIRQQ